MRELCIDTETIPHNINLKDTDFKYNIVSLPRPPLQKENSEEIVRKAVNTSKENDFKIIQAYKCNTLPGVAPAIPSIKAFAGKFG